MVKINNSPDYFYYHSVKWVNGSTPMMPNLTGILKLKTSLLNQKFILNWHKPTGGFNFKINSSTKLYIYNARPKNLEYINNEIIVELDCYFYLDIDTTIEDRKR